MKRKILALGLFSLCSLAFFTGEAQAFFGLLSPYHPSSLWNRHNRYVTQITCRPYNAFTPIAWGNLVCDGCNPSPCGVASGQLPMTMGAPPWASPGYGPGFGGCGPQGCMASNMPLMQGPPMHMAMPMPGPGPMPDYNQPFSAPMPMPMPMPDNRNQPFNAPMPMPLPPGPNMSMYPPPGVAQANYYPMYPQPYYPEYYMPTYYNPYMAWQSPQPAAPYYWYNGR